MDSDNSAGSRGHQSESGCFKALFVAFVGAVVPIIYFLGGFEIAIVVGLGTVCGMIAAIGVSPNVR